MANLLMALGRPEAFLEQAASAPPVRRAYPVTIEIGVLATHSHRVEQLIGRRLIQRLQGYALRPASHQRVVDAPRHLIERGRVDHEQTSRDLLLPGSGPSALVVHAKSTA